MAGGRAGGVEASQRRQSGRPSPVDMRHARGKATLEVAAGTQVPRQQRTSSRK